MADEKGNPYLADELKDTASVFRPGEGRGLRIGGSSLTMKVTSEISNGQLGVYEIVMEPNTVGAQLHFHRFMDETFIVTEGTLTVRHGTETVDAPAGSVIHVPRFTPHGFANMSRAVTKLMLIFNPAQNREGFFYGMHQILTAPEFRQEDFLKLYHKYDSYLV